MKKLKLLLGAMAVIMLITACNSVSTSDTQKINSIEHLPPKEDGLEIWNKEGLYFTYPRDIIATYGESGDIHVEKTTLSGIVDRCYQQWLSKWEYPQAENQKNAVIRSLKSIKEEGLTYNNAEGINNLESIHCGSSGGNIRTFPIDGENYKGVIFLKSIGNAGLPTYYLQALVLNKHEDVYLVTINLLFDSSTEEKTNFNKMLNAVEESEAFEIFSTELQNMVMAALETNSVEVPEGLLPRKTYEIIRIFKSIEISDVY